MQREHMHYAPKRAVNFVVRRDAYHRPDSHFDECLRGITFPDSDPDRCLVDVVQDAAGKRTAWVFDRWKRLVFSVEER